MCQVLFRIPLKSWFNVFYDIPIHGYGFMLFLAFVFCTLLAVYLARKQGIAAEQIHDLALWLFICGIIGARVTYVIQHWNQFNNLGQFFMIWDGGLVFYGSALGGFVGYLGFYWRVMKPRKIPFWRMADIIAPCAALGLCLGRIGCLLNGCCYGGVACPNCFSVQFPLPATPRYVMVSKGYQTSAGFVLKQSTDEAIVEKVVPDSPAARAGLEEGDVITKAEDKLIHTQTGLSKLFADWQSKRRGQNFLHLIVQRNNERVELDPFKPVTIGLHPTQIYEAISTGLLTFLLLSFYPLRRRDGEVWLLFMAGYSVHRFINENIRIDTDPVAFGWTQAQNFSVIFFALSIVLFISFERRPIQYGPKAPPPTETPPAEEEPPATPPPERALQD